MASPSLYRRYRPRRFAEVKGQDHVVRALRDSVAGGREGQAYLFSGPRGTGKTTSARILAKVLNCERPEGGEPCCECESCLAVERGVSYDVHELDAASNNGVDAMRDLIERASLGTPGRHKVYILDEVHMLSKAAEAALLKTLEEPPPHVVFVLATTDPQKVSDTIRSRTQHLRFHLLPVEILAEHVRWVVADAGLDLDDAAIEAALAQGGGSARDTLSALELIANAGGAADDEFAYDEFVEAMIQHDPGQALAAMARAINEGHEPRLLAEGLVRHLRNSFLAILSPELLSLGSHKVEHLTERGQRLGLASIVGGITRLGEVLTELRHAPDPRVLVEVALIQLSTAPLADADDVSGLAARVGALERAAAAAAAAPGAAPAPVDPSTGRTALGGRARRPVEATAPGPAVPPIPAAERPAAELPADVTTRWESVIRPTLRPLVRALFTPVDLVGHRGGKVTLAAPNSAHRSKCEQHLAAVEQAWADAGLPATIELVVGGSGGDDTAGNRRPDVGGADDIDLDRVHDLPDAGAVPGVLDTFAHHFPGTVVEENEASR